MSRISLLSTIASVIASATILASCTDTESAALRDGTYVHRETYAAGADDEYAFYMDVAVTLSDGAIESLSITPDPGENAHTVQGYAEEIKNGLSEKMIGKTLDEAKELGYVSGASLASTAFAEALEAIAMQASADETATEDEDDTTAGAEDGAETDTETTVE